MTGSAWDMQLMVTWCWILGSQLPGIRVRGMGSDGVGKAITGSYRVE